MSGDEDDYAQLDSESRALVRILVRDNQRTGLASYNSIRGLLQERSDNVTVCPVAAVPSKLALAVPVPAPTNWLTWVISILGTQVAGIAATVLFGFLQRSALCLGSA